MQPSLEKLFRLLAKPERDQLFDRIKAELEACGNDLSSVQEGEFPYGNFRDPKLLRLLLKAGLPPATLDAKGYSLLIQAAVNPACLKLLLQAGVDVNHVCRGDDATALMRASRLGAGKSVELLLENGADGSVRDARGRTALDLVDRRSRDRKKIETLLQDTKET